MNEIRQQVTVNSLKHHYVYTISTTECRCLSLVSNSIGAYLCVSLPYLFSVQSKITYLFQTQCVLHHGQRSYEMMNFHSHK